MITDYDVGVLCSLNRIQNNDEFKPKELTSWLLTKNLSKTKKANDLENSSVLSSLKKMNKMGLVNLDIEETKNKIRKIWTLNSNKVFFCVMNINKIKKKVIKCIIDDKLFIREL